MKKIVSILLAATAFYLILQSCESQKVILNREVDTTSDGKMLLGNQAKSQFLKPPYSDWYNKEHDEYEVDKKAIEELKKAKLKTYGITVVMGTWCEDSHREVPRFFKILEAVGYPENKVKIIAVNRKKEAPNGEDGPLNIQKIPTFIINKYGKETGRIIESSKSGYLERDLVEIVNKSKTSKDTP